MRRFNVMLLLMATAGGCGTEEQAAADATASMEAAATASSFSILASNDLGMHCACPGVGNFLLLPPYNTLRAQVFKKSSDPSVVTDNTTYKLTYNIVENTDANLKADPYYADWITNAPKIFPGYQPVRADGKIQGIGGATLAGEMKPNTATTTKFWEAAGIPAFPVVTGTSADVMTDPLGGAKRDPYLTGRIQLVQRSTNAVLASDDVTVPVAFGGCCSCHLKVAQANGFTNPTPANSFQVMGKLHARDSKIDLWYLDPDGDGKNGPVRCSTCHWDPAMGEAKAPGLAAVWPSYKILPGATFTSADVRASKFTFSDVLHRFHVKNTTVLSSYDANIAKNCYDCHPGNNVNCYRDTHTTKKNAAGQPIWCTDCHGDLNQRVAQNQMAQPWMASTLPKCATCHGTSSGEGRITVNLGIFGQFLNSGGHHDGKVLCSSCHGSPHALSPSNLAKDNAQNLALQADARAIGKCNVCHTDRGSTWQKPPHLGD